MYTQKNKTKQNKNPNSVKKEEEESRRD